MAADSTEDLARLVRSGKASTFSLEIDQMLEEGKSPSLALQTFEGKTITNFHFRGISLANVAFEECTFTECTFEECDLEGTFFDGSTMLHCTFKGCTGEAFAFDTCTITKSTFDGIELRAPEWTDTQINESTLLNVVMHNAFIERTTLRDCAITNLRVVEGDLTHVTFRGARGLKSVDLEGVKTRSCYVVSDDDEITLPAGFRRKSGQRRTL